MNSSSSTRLATCTCRVTTRYTAVMGGVRFLRRAVLPWLPLGLVAAGLAPDGPAHGQSPAAVSQTVPNPVGTIAPIPPIGTITVNSQLVLVPTEVRTRKGEIIYGLQAADFALEADGVRQRVRLDESVAPLPISLVVLVQCSRSAALEGPKIKGLTTMVEAIAGGGPAQVALVDFGKELEMLTNLTDDPAKWEGAFAELQPCEDDPGNGILDAVAFANRLLDHRHAPGRRVVLLISETRDHGSKTDPARLIEALGSSNTVVESVAFSALRAEETARFKQHAPTGMLNPSSLIYAVVQAFRTDVPKELSRQTGGEYINFSSENGFDRSLNTLANRLHNGYPLSFVPHFPPGSPAAGEDLHRLTVHVTKYPDAALDHRASYSSVVPASAGTPLPATQP